MSVIMSKADGVTVFTVTSDTQSVCPPLCQIIKGLCYSPVCCSVSQSLRKVQRSSQSILGALHIMVGLLNIGLGAILCSSRSGSWYQMDETGFPFWLGGVFMLFGVIGIVSEKCPSPCLVIINVILNLAGVGFAIASIVLYSINIAHIGLWLMCRNKYDYNYDYYSRHRPTATPSPWEEIMKEKCLEGKELVLMLLRSMNAVLIVLSALELCLVISSAVMGIKALRSSEKEEDKKTADPEHYNPLLEEVTSTPVA
ncbi:transmembrane protein 176B-like isoform X2 [Epinephelus moara]|nr:transmembrane protein 176B-like isoform X2 [Epinephelus moara]XP_049901887.1 transmembrane protein 176B-like isoform X2 [Epinephelus moara]XP_049901888.1 transmembrane protein 176B-like isoform X2 [Epinephelus moara]XP_049901889.1 transmembrane protein 176B-like isoform X2 [Epinephelus moara]XP_049901890.1 transmembrane protein 176B-like isoform X2 [Epinephelus moara]